MKVPLFPEIKVYSNHKPQLFPEDAGVEVGEPLSEGFCLFPGLLFLPGAVSVLILVMLSGAENQGRAESMGKGKAWDHRRCFPEWEQGVSQLS